ncbi:glycosyltransferase family 2 protein [Pectinatus frisingensis]|uniref:glycosyltransferase family 2 protein n=1 Tax=Pectinatus frisingensis TaxID=865 RepID=UPI0018C5567B|nr:glycosyltransferase family 2 protein [Pectinatus frisingensis]
MMKKLKISIITVCYNSEKTIEKTIKSVINQEYDNIEYIIIDGGSIDGTLDIIKKYSDKIAYWISEADNGIYDAMNKGIRIATGDVIGIINSDDWYIDNVISLITSAFHNGADAVYGDLLLVDQSGQSIGIQHIKEQEKDLIGKVYPHPTIFLRRNIYIKYGFFDTSYDIAADYKLTSLLEMHGVKFVYIPQIIAAFRSGGISNNTRKWRCLIETKRVIKEIENHNLELHKTINFKIFIRNYRWFFLRQYIRSRIRRIKDNNFSDKFLKRKQKQKYVVWGAGLLGHECIQWLDKSRSQIKYIIDSDVNKQKKKIDNILVIGLEQTHLEGCLVIITPNDYFDEIAEKLILKGYKEDSDYISFREYQEEMIRDYIQSKLIKKSE